MADLNLNSVPVWGKVSICFSAAYAFWQAAKSFFSLVPRTELLAALKQQRAEQERRHSELTDWMRRLDGRVGGVEQGVAALRGEMSARESAGGERR